MGTPSYVLVFKRLQVVSVSTDGDILPLVELCNRLGQYVPDTVVAIAPQQDHRGEFLVLRDPLTLDNIYNNIDTLLRISRLVLVVSYTERQLLNL